MSKIKDYAPHIIMAAVLIVPLMFCAWMIAQPETPDNGEITSASFAPWELNENGVMVVPITVTVDNIDVSRVRSVTIIAYDIGNNAIGTATAKRTVIVGGAISCPFSAVAASFDEWTFSGATYPAMPDKITVEILMLAGNVISATT